MAPHGAGGADPVITHALIDEFTAAGWWGRTSYVSHLLGHARARPDATAIVDGDQRMSFAALADAANRLAKHLADLGVGRGDVVGLQLPNVAAFHVARYALSALGALTLPIGVVYRERELLHALGRTQAVAVVAPAVFNGTDHARMLLGLRKELPRLRYVLVTGAEAPAGTLSLDALMQQAVDAPGTYSHLDPARSDPNRPDLLILSSGTTGLSKIIMATPNAWLHTGAVTARLLGLSAGDVVLALPPLTGGAGYNNGLGSPAVSGATVVLQAGFDAAEAVERMRREGVTSVAAVPAQAIKMLELMQARGAAAIEGCAVRTWLSVGAYLPMHTAQQIEARLGCRVVNIYGAVEAATIAANRPGDDAASRHTTIGRLVDGTRLRLLDEAGREVAPGEVGEIVARLPSMAAGYLGDAEATAQVFGADGWVRVGDCASIDADGHLRIQGRAKDIISRGAMKISAEEIEDLLRGHPAVRDVAVVAMPDAVLGEKVCAYVVARDGPAPTLPDLVSFLRLQRLAAFKLPERLEIVPEFPYSAGLKVQKSVLREDIARKLGPALPLPHR
jgi:non-ribosomal peptide synthetase component E (peptide arylation enzyme)